MVIARKPFEMLLDSDDGIELKVYRNIVEIRSSKIVNDNVRVRDHLLDKSPTSTRIPARSPPGEPGAFTGTAP